MTRVSRSTLDRVVAELSAWSWDGDDLEELAAPRFGIISGFSDLLAQLDELRALDLQDTPPCAGIKPTLR